MAFKRKRTILSALRINPTQTVVLGFGGVILLGALVLSLPISSRSGAATDLITSLFTATSATCVTGLIVVDTYQHWSAFGQMVILSLIQIGGLGFMSIAAILSFLFRRQISLKERLIMQQSLNASDISGIVRVTKHAIYGTLLTEGLGAVILSVRFAKDFGLQGGIVKGIFHSVSAFCNAGFDLMGEREAFSSLMAYSSDFVVIGVISTLIVAGGLGFFVWEDIFTTRSFRRLMPYTKLVLLVTSILLVGGAVLIGLFEYHNPGTLGALDMRGKILAPWFQSVTVRTAGFNSINQAAMTEPSQAISTLLMFIGGSSGSTAGGVKTASFAILVMTIFQVARGKRNVVIFKRKINNDDVLRSVSLVGIGLFMVLLCTIAISAVEDMNMFDVLYECVSAFATVGISMGITAQLSVFSQLCLVALMFAGRVGILTISFATVMRMSGDHDLVQYPETKVVIG